MPKRITICFAVSVTFSRSLEAPVVISLKTISSAARPPSVIAIVSVSSARVVRNLSSVGQRDRVAERLAAADDRDLVDRVAVRQQVADDRVAHLVVGGDQALLLRHHPGLLLGAGDHAHDPLLELDHRDLALARARGQQRRLVDQVGEVGAGEAGGLAGERVEVDLLGERLAAGVDLEDLLAALAVGAVDDDLAVEAARAAAAPGRGCRAGWWRRSG